MLRKLMLLVLLALLFVATAAPMGGGFGGGRGGFSGGFRSGGFGSSGFGSRSYGSGSFGSPGLSRRYGGPMMPIRYGPGLYIGRPWHVRTSPFFLLAMFLVIALVVGGTAAAQWYASRFTAVSIGLLLRRGDRYAHRLDEILSSSDFSEPRSRVRALHRLCKLIDTDDIVDGYVRIDAHRAERTQAGIIAEESARATMKRTGTEARTVNVADNEGNSVQLAAPESNHGIDPNTRCILTIVLTASTQCLRQVAAGGEKQTVMALNQVSQLTGRELDALYTFYTPDSAESLGAVEAARIFADLSSTAAAHT